MFLTHLKFLQFRNIPDTELVFSEGFNGLFGSNGSGKTNVLDAIHFICLTKGYFGQNDAQNAFFGENYFSLIAQFSSSNSVNDTVFTAWQLSDKKVFKLNNEIYPKLGLHVGKFPVVMIAPADLVLITGGSEERRKFLDNLLSQADPDYLQALLKYTRLILRRNLILKDYRNGLPIDLTVLDVLDMQLLDANQIIVETRKKLLADFEVQVTIHYDYISDAKETVSISNITQSENSSWVELATKNRNNDLQAGRTTFGPHLDDLQILLNGFPAKRFASQGQLKTLVLSLKLAQYDFISTKKGKPALLLLDDIFEKLDEHRLTKLIELISQPQYGQKFLSHTSSEALESLFKKTGKPFKLIKMG